MAESKNAIKKQDWMSSFTLVGKPVINDYTFKIDEKSQKSSWIYNSMSLLVDCGEKHGRIMCEMLGGYSPDSNGFIYAHGKDENGHDDFSDKIQVPWEDRNDEDIKKTLGDMCFVTVGIEKDDKDKTWYKKFLSEYDAIAYINEHLTNDMVVRITGSLKYSVYNDNVQVRKTINSIVLSKVEDVNDFYARFTQSVLIDNDSVEKEDIDMEKGVMYVNGRVLDYVKEINGVEIKGQYPMYYVFEYAIDPSNKPLVKKVYEKLFKVKSGVRQITFEGEFIEGGAVATTTWDDVPDDIKELVELQVYTKEQAIAKCSANGSRERRMVLKAPYIRKVGEEQTPVLQVFDEQYTEDELDMSWVYESDSNKNDKEDDTSSSDDDMSWLEDL